METNCNSAWILDKINRYNIKKGNKSYRFGSALSLPASLYFYVFFFKL